MSDSSKSGRHRRGRTRLLAVLVAVLTVGVGLLEAAPSLGGTLTASPSTVGGSPHGSWTATPAQMAAFSHVGSRWNSSTVGQREAYVGTIELMTPTAIAKATHLSLSSATALRNYYMEHPSVVLQPFDQGGFINSLIGAGVGCAVGGVIGSFVPVVGTAAGCAVGAVATLLGIAYFTSSAGGLGIAHEDGLILGQAQAFANAQNASTAFLKNTLSLFNATLYAWMNAADHVAVNQIGNASFNYTLDVAQSGVGAIFDSLLGPYVAQTSLDLNNLNVIMNQIYSPMPSHAHDYIVFGDGACLGICASTFSWYGAFSAFLSSGITSGQGFVEVLPFGPVALTAAAGGSCSLFNVMTNSTVLTAAASTTKFVKNFTVASGGFLLIDGGSASCNLNGPGVINLPLSPVSNPSGNSITVATCVKGAVPGSCQPLNHTQATAGNAPDTIQAFNSSGSAALMPVETFLGGVFGAYFHQFNSMMTSVETNAYTYWLTLRTLGYTSISQVPSNCLIPAPDLAVPPVNLGNVGYTVNYTESAYQGMLNAIGNFYPTYPNATGGSGFCHGHTAINLGFSSGPGLGQNISGFVLTLPVGTHQKWKAPHTWAVNGSNVGATTAMTIVGATNATPISMTLWSSVVTYGFAIPLNTVVMVPINDPIIVAATQTLGFYTLDGNGSAITSLTPSVNRLSSIPSTSTAGAELYLTSCKINGIPEDPCVINGTSFSNVTGSQSGGGPGPIFFPSGTCGSTVPLLGGFATGIANAIGGIPFIGSSGCLIGWAVVGIVVLIIVIAVVWVIAAFVRRD